MKRFVSILLAALMLVSVFAIPAAARGYTLSVDKTGMGHNLESFGLHTLNVYSTFTPPTVDGVVSTGEYPGPNNGCSLSAVPGDNMFFTPATGASVGGDQKGFLGRTDVGEFIADEDKPQYINNYLTYDEEYFYFAVTTAIPEIRDTSSSSGEDNHDGILISGKTLRDGYWRFYTFVNFMQTEALQQANNTMNWTRYLLYKGEKYTTANSVKFEKRDLNLLVDGKSVTTTIGNYTDPDGVVWNTTTYKAAANFTYQITVYEAEEGAMDTWAITFEGRMPLGDVLRFTDVEYDDGTPIDYVPGWGTWGCAISLQANADYTSGYTANGTFIDTVRNDVFYAQTAIPTKGYGEYNVGAYVGGFLFSNTLGDATGASRLISNPVRFLGVYDGAYDYDAIYSEPSGSALASVTSRVTRTRAPMLTSGVRGVNNRVVGVVGVATTAASATGDSITMTVVLSAVMLLCAAGVVAVVVMKKRSKQLD